MMNIAMNASARKILIIVTSVYPLDDQKRMIGDADDYYDKTAGRQVLFAKIKRALA